ncbi:hypothetical protein FXB61_005698 [Bacillus cereus]|uniref:tail assembly chaperone n=1 Tax=Bacillus cereus TaxID=1396 RepID=UPI00122CA23C|nr:tail assembly chaperone [Bacillus cereus]KAA1803584.1 hypothetical protein FXB61_005698 [Bacillus cereus]
MRFEIEGKEYELKLTYKSIAELNKKYEGGANQVIAACLQGDLDLFEDAVYFGLMHTEEGFTRAKVTVAIEKLFVEEKITQQYIEDVLNEVVADNFFYKAKTKQYKNRMKKQLLAKNPDFKEIAEEMYGTDDEPQTSLEKK